MYNEIMGGKDLSGGVNTNAKSFDGAKNPYDERDVKVSLKHPNRERVLRAAQK